jgi:hypothetical protein
MWPSSTPPHKVRDSRSVVGDMGLDAALAQAELDAVVPAATGTSEAAER